MQWHHPVLTCSESRAFEHRIFRGRSDLEAAAMERAGKGLARQLTADLGIRMRTGPCNCLVLLGKGHNAGDAMIAAWALLEAHGNLEVVLVPVLGTERLSRACGPWWERLRSHPRARVSPMGSLLQEEPPQAFALSIDGVFGMQFRAPLSNELAAIFERLNAWEIGVRIAVDLPSGLGDESVESVLRADFTYATGILKAPLLKRQHRSLVGRVRYVDIGFFDLRNLDCDERVAAPSLIASLKELRSVECDKRSFGHLLIVAGSRSMPGALSMSVQAALRSGVGLVSVVAPESVVPQLAARMPEAMWVPWPEAPEGGLALEGVGMLERLRKRITAVLLGPGCGREPETQTLLDDICERFDVPLVLDADALTRERIELLQQRRVPVILTPHEGEFRRIAALGRDDPIDAAAVNHFVSAFSGVQLVLKGPVTQLCSGRNRICFPMGNPVLARGGSGDILAGLVSGKVAMSEKKDLDLKVAQAIACHALAADRLSSLKEETHVCTTDILNYLNQY